MDEYWFRTVILTLKKLTKERTKAFGGFESRVTRE
jgi:hypothetical protein